MAANGVELATAYVSLTVDGSKVDQQALAAGKKAGEQFTRGVDGRLRDSKGRFVGSGSAMGEGARSGFLGAFGKIAGPIAAIFAGIKVGRILGDSIDEAIEAQKVGAATDAILKATGGVAKVSSAQVSDLSGSLSELIGVDDEIIQNSANLLLTFKNIRNEAGKNNDIFNQSVKTAQDLSAAGFGSIESASKTLGKALNDPVKGMTALGRAGVTFSDAQKKQIANMVKSGDLLGAQKLILAEVQSQVGGVAEATATTSEKVNVAWKNVEEEIGTALLPMLERLGRWFLDKGLPAIKEFGGWVKDELWPALRDGWETVRPGLEQAQQIIADAFGGDNKATIKGFADFFTNTLIPVISTFVDEWLPIMARQLAATIEVVKLVWGAFITLRDIVIKVTSVILEAFSKMLNAGADMLDAISVVPGFGWAKDAADKLRGVANKANDVADALARIKDKTVDVTVRFNATYRNTDLASTFQGVGGRAHGGPVRKGQPYIVGENRPELFVPDSNGRILPRVPSADSAPAAMGGFDYWRMGDAVAGAMSGAQFAVGVRETDRAVSRHRNQKQAG